MSKSQLTLPFLRFKEFEGEWCKYFFEKNIQIFDGPHKTPKYFNNGYPFYSVETITDGLFKYIDEYQYDKFNKIYNPKINDILFTKIGVLGKCKIVKELGFSIYVSICALRITNEKIHYKFLFHSISTYKFQKNLWENSLLTAVPAKINIVDMYKLSFYAPTYNEQQKIAHFFSLLDKQIQLWERKLELTELLFNKKLNLIFSYKKIKQSTIILKDVIKIETLKNKEKLNLSIGTISNKLGLIEQTTYFDGNTLASDDLSNYYILKENWFAYNPARINVGSITVNNKKKIYLISPMYIIFSCKNEKLTKSIFYYTKSHCFNQFIKSKISGTVRNTLNSEALQEIPFISSNIVLEIKQLEYIEQYLENLKLKIKCLYLFKNYYLNKIFI